MPTTEILPRIAWDNELRNSTSITSRVGEAELTRAAVNAVHRWRAKVAESRNRTIEIVTGQNDTLDFRYDIGAGWVVDSITVDDGTYRCKNLAASVKTALNLIVVGGFLSSYSEDTFKYTIAGTGDDVTAFEILHQSGANKVKSISKTLGYDVSANDTGGLTYEADYVRTSTWGIFAIDSSNNTFSQVNKFTFKQYNLYFYIAIETGVATGVYTTHAASAMVILTPYTGTEAAAVLQGTINGFGGDYTAVTVVYNTGTHLFTIAHPTLRIYLPTFFHDGATAGPSIWKTFGFDLTAHHDSASAATSLTSEYTRTGTHGSFDIDASHDTLRVSGTDVTPIGTVAGNPADGHAVAAMIAYKVAFSKFLVGGWIIDVDYVESTGKFRVKRKGGASTWEWSHANTTIEAILGFDAVDDSPADNVYADGDTAVGPPVTGLDITIDTAEYNAHSVSTQLVYQLDAAGYTDVDVDYVESTHKFRVKTAIGTLEFTATSFASVLGFTSDVTTTADVYSDADEVRINTEWTIEFDVASTGLTRDVAFAVTGSNIQDGADVRLQAYYSAAWHDYLTGTIADGEFITLYEDEATPTSTKFRLYVIDIDNPDGYLYAGYVFYGPWFEMERGPMWQGSPVEFFSADYSTPSMADYGQVAVTVKPQDDGIKASFEAITPTDRGNLESMQNALSIGPGFFLMLDYTNHPAELTYYVRLTERISFLDTGTTTVEPVNSGYNNYNCAMTVVESK